MPKSSALAIYLKYKFPVLTCHKCFPPDSNPTLMRVGANCVMPLPWYKLYVANDVEWRRTGVRLYDAIAPQKPLIVKCTLISV